MIKILDKSLAKKYLPEIMKIERQCFKETRWVRKNILLDLPGKWENSLIIKNNDKIAGYLVSALLRTNQMHIYRIAILPEYGRKGYGSKLLQQVINTCSSKSVKYITVEVCARFPVDRFYLKSGFKLLKESELIKYIRLRNRINTKDKYFQNENRVYKYSTGN